MVEWDTVSISLNRKATAGAIAFFFTVFRIAIQRGRMFNKISIRFGLFSET